MGQYQVEPLLGICDPLYLLIWKPGFGVDLRLVRVLAHHGAQDVVVDDVNMDAVSSFG
jgi:hypothetical protein